jgi:3-hydroxyacyl-CoA dehydrogenase
LTPEEEKKGCTLESPEVRNRIVNSLFEASKKLKPAAYMLGDNAKLVKTGNFTDDMAQLKDCDLVIEAVVENLDIKHKVFTESKNTASRVGDCNQYERHSDRFYRRAFFRRFKQHFVGVHFFNPPRYMKLVEVIPGTEQVLSLRAAFPVFSISVWVRACSRERPAELYRKPCRHIRNDGDGA